MTKKELAEAAKISTTRITQLMATMTKDVDYVEVKRGGHDIRIEFTASGIDKVMNRNRKGGRVKVERVKKARGRPRKTIDEVLDEFGAELNKATAPYFEVIAKVLSTIEKGGEV